MAVGDRKQHRKTIKKTCYTANIAYLLVHIFYLILFIISKFEVLIYVDAAVIAIYLLCFLLLQKEKYYIYALVCGNTFFAFVSVTTVMLGFASGFHFYLIGLCVVSFFTSYFSKQNNIKASIFWVGLSLAIYLTLYFVTEFNAPYYMMEMWLEVTLFTVHAVAVFTFIAAYLVVFVRYALSLEKKIINESRTDELTQINNRYALYDYFEQEEDKSSRALALFDIDDFKGINDHYGHVTGDVILQRVAALTAETLNDCFVCRYGGEEFVIVMSPDKHHSFFDRLETLRKAIEAEQFVFEGVQHHITITIGVAVYEDGTTLEKWVELADEKMYQGKSQGKNQTVI